jgi:hypothetical protein
LNELEENVNTLVRSWRDLDGEPADGPDGFSNEIDINFRRISDDTLATSVSPDGRDGGDL